MYSEVYFMATFLTWKKERTQVFWNWVCNPNKYLSKSDSPGTWQRLLLSENRASWGNRIIRIQTATSVLDILFLKTSHLTPAAQQTSHRTCFQISPRYFFPVDLLFVAADTMDGFFVAGNMHQFQVVCCEQHPVKVFPVHFPSVLDLECFCQGWEDGPFLLDSETKKEWLMAALLVAF